MLTLTELLQDRIFEQATVVAGHQGLNAAVEWAYMIDLPNMVQVLDHSDRLLILTTGQNLPQTPQAQKQLIAELESAGVIGLVVSLSEYLPEISTTFIEAGNRYHFPIITVPRGMKFTRLTRSIHERLINKQYTLLKRSDHIHQTLTQIILEGGGLLDLATRLSELVNRSVTIEDTELNLLASANVGETDTARRVSIEGGSTPTVLKEFVKDKGILDAVRYNLKPMAIPAFPEHGMARRIIAPILVNKRVYGYMWFIAGETPLDEFDERAIERAAIVAALILLNETAVRQTEARLQADVISQLLSEQPNSLAVEDKANRLGLDLKQAQRVLLLRPPAKVLPTLRLADRLGRTIKPHAQKFIIQTLGQNLILIVPDPADVDQLCHDLLRDLPSLKIGVGNTAPTLKNLAQSYRQAEEALEIGLLMDSDSVLKFNELGFLHWLYHLPLESRAGNMFAEQVKVLAEEEKAARADLLRTLEVFLDQGANAAETARVLKVHRNTLSYRLRQIEAYCGVSLSDPLTRVNLAIAVKAYHMEQGR